ncbi:MAG: LCP family protein [Treponema sp.]|nr:LCP family protein [Treponema sp.]MCL2272609.1 LCP family protein [Treponema sp.]
MKKTKIDASRFLMVLIIFVLVIGIFLAVYTFRSNPIDDALAGNRVINTLFIIENNKKPVSTYVLMYYPGTKRAAIFDIPGELGLLISKINRVDRIDSIYESGRIGSYQSEIEKLLGIEINFSFVITNENLVSIVDILEGVEIFIPSPVSYREDDQLVLFSSGMTVLDGDKASVYATYSLPYEEREVEIFRRQRFFLGLLDRNIHMNERLKNPDNAKLYYSFFNTPMNRRTMMLLFDEFVYIDTDRINIQSVGGTLREVSGQMLIIPHWDGNLVKEVTRQTLATLTRDIDEHLREQTLTIEVLNGTDINGLAGRTAEMLRTFGYDIISIGNADSNNYESTIVYHRSGDERLVKTFADVIRCSNIEQVFTSYSGGEEEAIIEYKADITLLIGRNFNGRYVTGN